MRSYVQRMAWSINFFWIIASATDILDDKLNGIKTLLANGVNTLFIFYKANINDGPYWLAIFLVVSFNEIPLFSKGLITFIISFFSWFVRVIPEPVTNEILLLTFLLIMLISGSTSRSLSVSVILKSFANEFANDVNFWLVL